MGPPLAPPFPAPDPNSPIWPDKLRALKEKLNEVGYSGNIGEDTLWRTNRTQETLDGKLIRMTNVCRLTERNGVWA